ncbi:MAG: LemA family protein [Paludibacteraceae bacterium]|nr:LemA family protein [Paludibacteraceae bacterium]
MSKKATWIVVIAAVAALLFWMFGKYNAMVTAEENVENAWGQVENQYQRRADLIPNLVGVVKQFAKHETEVYEKTMEARAKATQMTIDPSNATPEQLAAFQQAQGELSQALGRLMAVAESYPEIKSNENFLQLQSQLEGTENRIAVARNTFNDAAKEFNILIRKFPANIVASIFGFQKKPYFEAEEGANKAPDVRSMFED